MKKHLFILIAVMLVILSVLTSCKKDNDNNGVISEYRIVSEKIYDEDQQLDGESLYEYSDNKLSNASYTDDTESEEYHFEYPSENKILVNYTELYYDDDFDDHEGIFEITLSDNKVIEVVEDMQWKTIITYNASGDIEKAKSYNYYDGWELREETTFKYSSGKLVQITYQEYYGTMYEHKDEFTYNGEEINEIVCWQKEDGIWMGNFKYVYTYNSGNIIKIISYNYDEDYEVWWECESNYFNYDSHGNLISYEYVVGDEYYEKTEYSYEEGRGNFRQIFNSMYYYAEECTFPGPVKKSAGTGTATNISKKRIERMISRCFSPNEGVVMD